MFWINVLFWAIVVISIAISSRKPNFSYRSDISYEDYINVGNFEYALYYIINGIYWGKYNVYDDLLDFSKRVRLTSNIQDKIFGTVTILIANCAKKHPNWNGTLMNCAILWGYVCYAPVKTMFTVCCFVSIFGHTHYSYLLDYMDSSKKIIYYVVPFATFGAIIIIATSFFKKELGWPLFRVAFILSFMVSFPTAIITNDWNTAYREYSEEMEEEFGEDWEDELEDLRNESLYRRP